MASLAQVSVLSDENWKGIKVKSDVFFARTGQVFENDVNLATTTV